MCLIAFAFDAAPDLRLLLAANRDEFHARPTAALGWWPDIDGIVGGRDLEAGGSWLAVANNGRFACVTNARDAVPPRRRFRSRGLLISDFLSSDVSASDWLAGVNDDDYAGFNLLCFDGETLGYANNRGGGRRLLLPGCYGLSNAALDTPWFKVEYARRALRQRIADGCGDDEQLFALLGHREVAPDAEIDASTLPAARARALSAPFIVLPDYGTRCSTLLRIGSERVSIRERRYAADGSSSGDDRVEFDIKR